MPSHRSLGFAVDPVADQVAKAHERLGQGAPRYRVFGFSMKEGGINPLCQGSCRLT